MTIQDQLDAAEAARTPERLLGYRRIRDYWNGRHYVTFVGQGCMTSGRGEPAPATVSFSRYFPTQAEAAAFATVLPKNLKARSGRLSDGSRPDKGVVWFQIHLRADGVNRGVNETGLKRLRKLATLLTFEWDPSHCVNAMSEETFRSLL